MTLGSYDEKFRHNKEKQVREIKVFIKNWEKESILNTVFSIPKVDNDILFTYLVVLLNPNHMHCFDFL